MTMDGSSGGGGPGSPSSAPTPLSGFSSLLKNEAASFAAPFAPCFPFLSTTAFAPVSAVLGVEESVVLVEKGRERAPFKLLCRRLGREITAVLCDVVPKPHAMTPRGVFDAAAVDDDDDEAQAFASDVVECLVARGLWVGKGT